MIPIDQIIKDIEIIHDENDLYHYLIELGKKLPLFPKEKIIDSNILKECASKTWLAVEFKKIEDDDHRISLDLFSDSHIVRGLLYITRSIYEGKTVHEIYKIDAKKIFNSLKLTENLSMKRSNGILSVIEIINTLTMQYHDQ